jgi:hypothetical protein
VVPAVLAAGVTGYLAWGAWVSAANPRWFGRPPAWWQAPLQPGRLTPPLAFAGLWLATLLCFWWPRRFQAEAVGLVSAATMVLIGGVLASAALAPCRGGQSFSGVTGWVLDLYVGNPPSFPLGRCTTPALAFQAGAPVCLGATLTGALTAAAAVWREPLGRLRARAVRDAVILVGLNPLSLPLLQQLTRVHRRGSLVVIEPDSGHPLLAEARALGVKVMVADPASRRVLLPVLAGRRGCALRHLYALRDEVPDNEAVLETARGILRRYHPDPERQPHLVCRIDDPRHADHWRGRHSGTSGQCFEDALSPLETTACTLVSQVLRTGAGRLLLCGDGLLALAIVLELARRAWELGDLRRAAEAGRVARAARPGPDGHRPRPAPASWPAPADQAAAPPAAVAAAPPVRAQPAAWRDRLLATVDAMPAAAATQTVVVIAESRLGESMDEAGRVARLHPDLPLFVLAPDGPGHSRPIFGRLQPVPLALLADGRVPEDTWTRLARHWHECYRLSHPPRPGDGRALARRPWAELGDFIRQDNILQLRSVLTEVARRGREWRPVRAVPPGSFVELAEEDLLAVAQAEHTRWYERRRAAGWAPSPPGGRPGGGRVPPGADRVNSRVVPWTELSADDRRGLTRYLQSQLTQLEEAGYLPVIPPGGPPGAQRFRRIGVVHARRLQAPRWWLRRTGDLLRGEAGDWRVVDGQGEERTVRDPEFQRSHQPIGGGRYQRTGVFHAWQAEYTQVLRTREGRAVARPRDWIVEGASGERWPVTPAQFRHGYRRYPGPAGD